MIYLKIWNQLPNFFADDASIFHVVKNPNTSTEILIHDLTRISEWVYRWKMPFNLDPSKKTQEMMFSNKVTKTDYPNIIFNGNTAQKSANQKQLGLILDEKLTFNDHVYIRKNYNKNSNLGQWRRGVGFKDFVVFTKLWIIKHQVIFTVYFPHQIGTVIHVSIPELDRSSAEQKLLVIRFRLRQWNKLDTSTCQAPSYSVFRKALLDFMRLTANSTFGTNDVSDLKLLKRIVLVSAISENTNLSLIFKIHWTHCVLVPLKQKTPITFLCAAKVSQINEMSFLMTLIQLTRRF